MKAELEQQQEKKFEPITIKLRLESEQDLAFLYRMVALSCPSSLNQPLIYNKNTPEIRNSDPVFYSLWPILHKLADDMGW